MGGHPTKEGAVQEIVALAMQEDDFFTEGLTIRICCGSDLCGKVEPSQEEQDACTHCEVMVISPGGTA